MSTHEPKWQSKDLMFLFYEDSNYSLAVDEFLGSYYQSDFETRVHGRCGYIRQAFPFVIKDYDFSKLSLLLDGPNSQLSDLDFYDAVRRLVKGTRYFDADLASNYYHKNKFITYFQTNCEAVVQAYLNGLTQVLNYYEKQIYLKGSF